MKDIKYILFGIAFGIILTKAEVISWFRIHDMFLFKEAHMYLIIGSAIATAALSVLLIKYFKVKTLDPNEEEGRIGRGPGVVDINDKDAAAAKTRQWDREKSVRTLP